MLPDDVESPDLNIDIAKVHRICAGESQKSSLPSSHMSSEAVDVQAAGDSTYSTDAQEPCFTSAEVSLRPASLYSRFSNGSLVTLARSFTEKTINTSSFTKADSPASRSGSLSSVQSPNSLPNKPQGLRRVSGSIITGADGKNISRIPVAGSRKGSVADIKQIDTSSMPQPQYTSSPSFGLRRLTSSNALEKLEHGTKRCQQGSNSYDRGVNISIQNQRSENTLPLRSDKSTSPFGLSRSNTSYGFGDSGASWRHENLPKMLDNGQCNPNKMTDPPGALAKLFQDTDFAVEKVPPPSNSPFTEPLETIPSQAIFPAPIIDPTSPEWEYNPSKDTDETDCFTGSTTTLSTTTNKAALMHAPSMLRSKFSQEAFDNNDDDDHHYLSTPGIPSAFLQDRNTPSPCDFDNEDMEQLLGHLKVHSIETPNKQLLQDGNDCDNGPLTSHRADMNDNDGSAIKFATTDVESFPASSERRPSLVPVTDIWSPQPDESGRKGIRKSISNKNINMSARMKPLPKRPANTNAETSSVQKTRHDGHPSRSVSSSLQRFPLRTSSHHPPPQSPSQGASGSVRAARDRIHLRKSYKEKLNSTSEPQSTENLLATETRAIHRAQRKASGNPITPVQDRSMAQSKSGHSQEQPLKVNAPATSEPPRNRSMFGKLNGLFSTKRDKKGSFGVGAKQGAESSAVKSKTRPDQAEGFMTKSKGAPSAAGVPDAQFTATRDSLLSPQMSFENVRPRSLPGGRAENNMLTLIENLIERAQRADTPRRKYNLLAFAEIFSDIVIEARQSQINCVNAQALAQQTHMSYQMIQRSLTTLQRLAEVILRDE